MSSLRITPLESKEEVKVMTPKLLPILILLLFASCASATVLHGTLTDVDTGAAIDDVTAQLTVVDVYDETVLDTTTVQSGKFELEAPNDTVCYVRIIGDDSQRETCYFVSFKVNTIKNQVSYYPPPTDEIYLRFAVANCDSDTPSRIERDPDHPGPDDGDDGDDGDGIDPGGAVYIGPKTPGGMTPTSVAGRVGGGIIAAMLALAAIAVAVLAGIISLPALIVIAAIAVLAFVVGFVLVPLITKLGVWGLSWITGTLQDLGNSLLTTFGIHLDDLEEMTPGEALRDVVHTITETIIREFIDRIVETTGLPEQVVLVLLILGGVMMMFSILRR